MSGETRHRLTEATGVVVGCAGLGVLGAVLSAPTIAHQSIELGVILLLALVGSAGSPAAGHTTRAIIFLIIATGLGHAAAPWAMGALYAAGATVTVIIAEVVLAAEHRLRPQGRDARRVDIEAAAATPSPTLRGWLEKLHRWSGWQYPARLCVCLAAAFALGHVGHLGHLGEPYWISLTIAIVVQRRRATGLRRVWQRCAGTALGALAGSVLLAWTPPAWFLVVLIALLAAARPVLKSRNYLIYASVMTPLIFLVLDLGTAPLTLATALARLLDTGAGCLIAVVGAYLLWWWLPQPPPRAAAPAG